ncbi:phage tail spike protein [Metabacillus arenae]|uniref:Prophage tail endopeptidase domain-containing protein n=1 Tax=Metabacillus arenae TaxID=2771434 RepID=A0A926NE86_9BACI|nr:phage tail spike protein [Metabacillus arenae]MBD1379230.1 hypothetical protein [Metabacillus arenae]
MSSIGMNVKPKKISLFLAKPDRKVIRKITDTDDKNQIIKFSSINELSFSIPYETIQYNKVIRNPVVDMVRERYLIKAVKGEEVEWYIILKKRKTSTDVDKVVIECFSLGYDLSFKKMIDYQRSSYNCLQVLEDCLEGTNWKVGYISNELNLIYRQFDVTSKTKLDFLNEICETFEAVYEFDTVNLLVNIYKKDESSKDKGFIIKYGQYLDTIEETIDIEQVITRLVVSGSDGVSINSINPTGQSYIDNFSYYLYPFERNEEGEVIQSSHYMSDALCHAILDYNELVEEKQNDFKQFLDSKTETQEKLTTLNNELSELEDDLVQILDTLELAKDIGDPTSGLNKDRDNKTNHINNKKEEIKSIELQISNIDSSIQKLKDEINIENNLTSSLMAELTDYIFVEEWSDTNQINDVDLYEAALEHFKEINTPPININLSIVNFFEIVEENHNWNRLSIGDIVTIRHDKLKIDVKTTVTEMHIDYENASISLTISNTKDPESEVEQVKRLIYAVNKTSTDFEKRKLAWERVANNSNIRNDRISDVPVSPTLKTDETAITHKLNDNGSVDLTIKWEYPSFSKTNDNKHNIDGFIVYLYSSDLREPYIFGSTVAKETLVDLNSEIKKYTFPSVPANLYYTLGIRAYRRVDVDINREGIILSEIATSKLSKDNPYQPSDKVVVNGEMNGKLNGITYSSSPTPPENPESNDVWTNPTTKIQNVYNSETETWDGMKSTALSNGTVEVDVEKILDMESRISDNGNGTDIESFPIIVPETDDTGRIQRAIDHVAANGFGAINFYFKNYIAKKLTLKSNVWLVSKGAFLTFKSGETGDFLYANNINNVVIDGFTIEGLDRTSYAPSSTIGSRTGVYSNGSSEILLKNCLVQGFNKNGLYVTQSGATDDLYSKSVDVKNVHFFNNFNAMNFDTRAEYCQIHGVKAYSNYLGIRVASGNVHTVGSFFNNNVDGIQVVAGENDSHGSFTACTSNHNQRRALMVDGISHGELFNGCNFSFGEIYIKDSMGVQIKNGRWGSGISLYLEGGNWNSISDNLFATPPTIFRGYNSKPDKTEIKNNRDKDGHSRSQDDVSTYYINCNGLNPTFSPTPITSSTVIKFATGTQSLFGQTSTLYDTNTGQGAISYRRLYSFNITLKIHNLASTNQDVYMNVRIKKNDGTVVSNYICYEKITIPANEDKYIWNGSGMERIDKDCYFEVIINPMDTTSGISLNTTENRLIVRSIN